MEFCIIFAARHRRRNPGHLGHSNITDNGSVTPARSAEDQAQQSRLFISRFLPLVQAHKGEKRAGRRVGCEETVLNPCKPHARGSS
jgi:hypothetical protein